MSSEGRFLANNRVIWRILIVCRPMLCIYSRMQGNKVSKFNRLASRSKDIIIFHLIYVFTIIVKCDQLLGLHNIKINFKDKHGQKT